MKKKLLIFLVAIAAIVTGVSLTACNRQTTTFRIVAPDGAPALALTNLVKFGVAVPENEDLKIDIINASQISNQLLGKKCDIAIAPTNVAYKLYKASLDNNDTDPYKMIATATYGNLYIIGKNEPKSLSELEGKIVYSIGFNAIPHKVFEKIIDSNGLQMNIITKENKAISNKINVMFVADGSMVMGKLNLDNSAYGLLGEPAATIAETQKGYNNCFDVQQLFKEATGSDTYGYPQAIAVARESFIKANPDFVKRVYQALLDNVEFINNTQNQASITDILQNNAFGTPSATKFLPSSIARCNIKVLDSKAAKADTITLLNNIFGNNIDENFFYDLF